MYHYDSNGQKMPMNGQVKVPVKAKEHYGGSHDSDSSKKNTWIWVGIAIAVAVVLIVLFMWLRSKKGSSSSSGVMGMHRGNAHMGEQRWGFRFY